MAMRDAGTDADALMVALKRVRSDIRLEDAEREMIHRAVAMECYVWFLEAVLGEPVDRKQLCSEGGDPSDPEPSRGSE